ncbi:hypothetical protein INT47_012362 [Mucor saturninus]|uniref:Uncharacterized protein n=1 Tax=Mucor saturninus TaxID=64648 RepID=A0A8H7QXL4_9FUNG|nr:hypothetical protein INT47_012362 [Mucor saturninus]
MSLEVTFYPLPNSGHPIKPQLRNDNFVIVPRPDIILFRGSGERIMNSDQSLDYLITKLPKLEELRLFHVGLYSDPHEHFDFYHSFDVSFGTLVRFFHYMYHIPYLEVECNFRIKVLLDAWVEFMTVSKMNDIQLRIVYDPDSFEFDPQGLPMVFSTGLKKVLTKMMIRS